MTLFGSSWFNLGILSTAAIPFKASGHLHKFSLIFGTAAFAQIYNPLNMWRKDFCHLNYNQSSHELFLEGTLKYNGFCGRLGEPPTRLENHSEHSGEKARPGGTQEALWVSHSPTFPLSGVEKKEIQAKAALPKCEIWDPPLPSNPCPCIV